MEKEFLLNLGGKSFFGLFGFGFLLWTKTRLENDLNPLQLLHWYIDFGNQPQRRGLKQMVIFNCALK